MRFQTLWTIAALVAPVACGNSLSSTSQGDASARNGQTTGGASPDGGASAPGVVDGGGADADTGDGAVPDGGATASVRVVRVLEAADAALAAASSIDDVEACHAAWRVLEEGRGEQREGDPFGALVSGASGWVKTVAVGPYTVDLVPSRLEEIEWVASDATKPSHECVVPTAWTAAATGLQVTVPAPVKSSVSVTTLGSRHYGKEARAGILATFMGPAVPSSEVVLWFLDNAVLTAADIAAWRSAGSVPTEQSITLAPPQGPVDQDVAVAISFGASHGLTDARYWLIAPSEYRNRNVGLGALVRFGAPPSAETIVDVFAAARALSLELSKPWDIRAGAAVQCAAADGGNPCGPVALGDVDRVLTETLRAGKDLHARFVWQAGGSGALYVTEVAAHATGDVEVVSTAKVAATESLGLPSLDVLLGM